MRSFESEVITGGSRRLRSGPPPTAGGDRRRAASLDEIAGEFDVFLLVRP
jgi:hypothetical protein